MSIVLDANLLVAFALEVERGRLVDAKLQEWSARGEALHAPALMPYEVANALVRSIVAGTLAPDAVPEAWALIDSVPVELHPITVGPAIVTVARRLARSSAYDAAYVVLAQTLDAVLWTFDGPLARNAAGFSLPVRLLDAG